MRSDFLRKTKLFVATFSEELNILCWNFCTITKL